MRFDKIGLTNAQLRNFILCLAAFNFYAAAGTDSTSSHDRKNAKIYWQAHRGGGTHDRPDNTMAAFQYAWQLGGIPEADIRTTRDGVIICLHDETLARTTDAPAEVASVKAHLLDFGEIRKWDAGVKFAPDYQGEKVPSLLEVLNAMSGQPERELYMDIKQVDLVKTGRLIDSLHVAKQILVASPKQAECKTLRSLAAGVRSMLWIGGSAQEIADKFARAAENGFDGLDQVQIHLNDRKEPSPWRYEVDPALLQDALQQTARNGIDLEVFVKQFTEADLHALLDLGIRWYATDEPRRFAQSVQNWRKQKTADPLLKGE
ncbi:MAG TPA: glycerophosphodiester phosphodiesterase family protein [bacterium]|mgnify:CR=1 FL=1|nr:glycerophosphodiester phosphodiesterase family protein [bacterium]HPN35654.1 glycerophosphodiester phosphodiesterase family protein [bacterium]